MEYFSYLTMKSQGNAWVLQLLYGPASLEFLPITFDCIGYVLEDWIVIQHGNFLPISAFTTSNWDTKLSVITLIDYLDENPIEKVGSIRDNLSIMH